MADTAAGLGLKHRHGKSELCAIFVHAGAGFHSTANEHVHLEACHSASQLAMAVLKSGGSAVDAVEIAVKVLEDREITNAGYGSNLSMDGVVECDALVVDHMGRSGGVGAIVQVKNPVMAARQVLERSTHPLSLRRVPPNLLVGQGATDFAFEVGIPLAPHDALVSPAARDRWIRWRADLQEAEQRLRQKGLDSPSIASACTNPLQRDIEINRARESHTRSLKRSASTSRQSSMSSQAAADSRALAQARAIHEASMNPLINSSQVLPTQQSLAEASESSLTDSSFPPLPSLTPSPVNKADRTPSSPVSRLNLDAAPIGPAPQQDNITDTVGAIAVDSYGNIACAASSGGIGMKHRGRVGPAALVGVGAAVIPINPNDSGKNCIAAVTSGTGEHMATTLASALCADRLYTQQKRTDRGTFEHAGDDDIMRAFIERDFMGAVKNSTSTGAIGILTVRKNKSGIWLYYAHNTDSFAMASMGSEDLEPHLTMSRRGAPSVIANGGRFIRRRREKKVKTSQS
ncbi:N-terminal nucleophile aminohydrolase [Trichodelitschia bisporula]|uniref:N-terminal nucleophile aminohydrolase n=1 Tax=Trichodelitschia bisporula TaxID=703511 RepID=A0A6G1HZI5_9PEZI|nr:N-terminal nucleophile aminohydrolase [Trichodelitschia bisporula]